MDFDSTVIRLPLESTARRGHVWFGRVNPLSEGYEITELNRPRPTGAIGSSWAQNQTDALAPRVSGWVGFGVHAKSENEFFTTLAYSPIFLPSFTPKLDLSETAPPRVPATRTFLPR